MSAAAPPQGRLREQGEAKARRARLRARAAADATTQREPANGPEAAWISFPSGGNAAGEITHAAASVGAQQ